MPSRKAKVLKLPTVSLGFIFMHMMPFASFWVMPGHVSLHSTIVAITHITMRCTRHVVDPFCTIEPNVGIVEVPDSKLLVLQGIHQAVKVSR